MKTKLILGLLGRLAFYSIFTGMIASLIVWICQKFNFSISEMEGQVLYRAAVFMGTTQFISVCLFTYNKISEVKTISEITIWAKKRLDNEISERRYIALIRSGIGLLFSIFVIGASVYINNNNTSYWLFAVAIAMTIISFIMLLLSALEAYYLSKLKDDLVDEINAAKNAQSPFRRKN